MITESINRRRMLTAAAASGLLGSCATQTSRTQYGIAAAFNFAFPIYEFARTAWAAAAPNAERAQHRFNQIAARRTLAEPGNRTVTTPNNDTIYASARLDLSGGPVLLDVPDILDRYFSVAFMNMYTDNFAYIGTRATEGRGGRFLLVGPNGGRAPRSDERVITSATNDVWLLARVLVTGPDDLAVANAAQDQIKITQYADPNLPRLPVRQVADPAGFLGVVNEWLARSPLRDPVGARAARFEDFGIRPGQIDAWNRLSPNMKDQWRSGLAEGLARLRSGFAALGDSTQGWRYPPRGIGAPGDNDELRASVALSGLAALERTEAIYARCEEDGTGAPLSGAEAYRLRIPGNVPTAAFWSVSLYSIEPDGRLFFVENPISRYAISDRTPSVVIGPDGSIEIHISSAPPNAALVNWLPAPTGPFALVFRAYVPQRPLLVGAWRVPSVVRLRK